MGCGKTSLGKKLAKRMNSEFIDLDKIIEEKEALSVEEIFSSKGEDYFRKLETDWLSNFNGKNHVISLGGGTPCFHDNMNHINSIGTSVYLQLSSELLTDRLFNSKQKRPIIESVKYDKVKLNLEIDKLLKKRTIFYSKASVVFEASNMSSTKIECLIDLLRY